MKQNRKLPSIKLYILLFTLALLVLGTVGGTVAYLVRGGGSAVGVFEGASVTCEAEMKDGSIVVRNTGDTDVYIRAVVLVNWKDADGNVYSEVPVEGFDYTVEFADEDIITDANGFVYYTEKVAPQDEAVICSSAQLLTQLPDGYDLVTEVYAEAIQAEPAEAVVESWNVRVENGKISG